MRGLNFQDLRYVVRRLPKKVKELLEEPKFADQVFVAGGFIRSIVANEKVNDIDIFVPDMKTAKAFINALEDNAKKIYKTDNAYTIKKYNVQVIYRWLYDSPEKVIESFDFTIAKAAVFYHRKVMQGDVEEWKSLVDDRFYEDFAAKRLVYTNPIRNEDAGGSFLRVLKFYQRGYRIPLDSMGRVMTRIIQVIDFTKVDQNDFNAVARIVTAQLKLVDPRAIITDEAFFEDESINDVNADHHTNLEITDPS